MGGDQPAAAVGDFEAIDRLGHVGILAAGDFTDHAADRDLVAGSISGSVGVDVSAGRQTLGNAVGHAQARAGDVRAIQQQDR